MVAILLTIGKEAGLPVCAYSWFLQIEGLWAWLIAAE